MHAVAGKIDMKLADNDIHLHYVRPDRVTDTGLLEQYQALLSDDEKRQMSRFYFQNQRHQYLITRALIRSCLSLYHDVSMADWVFGKNAYDKPHAINPSLSRPVNFNISHADGMIICAFSSQYDIGVDVEDSQRATQASFQRLSSYFSADEIVRLESLPESLQKQRFFDIWTLKESYIKARGGGFSIPLSKFGFDFSGERLTGFKIDDELADHAETWQFWQLSMPPAYHLAIAVNAAEAALELSTFNTVPLTEPIPRSMPFLSRYPIYSSS